MKFLCCLIICTLFSPSICSQVTKEEKMVCDKCDLFFDPIIGMNFIMGESKEKILLQLDFYQGSKETLLPDIEGIEIFVDNTEYYDFSKNIILPNGLKSKVEGVLGFEYGVLTYFYFTFNIGEDYKYYSELIDLLESQDSQKVNEFLYNGEFRAFKKEEGCIKHLKVQRNFKNRAFDMLVKYTCMFE